MAYQFDLDAGDGAIVITDGALDIDNIWGPPPLLLETKTEEGVGTGGSTQTVTVSMGDIPFSGENVIVCASCSSSDDGTNTTTACTWKGSGMTLGRGDNFSLQQRTDIFYSVLGDVTGESGDLVFTISSTSGDCSRVITGYIFSGVDQGSPIVGTDGGNAGSTPFGDENCPTGITSTVVLSIVMNIHNSTSMTLSQLNDPGVSVQIQGSTAGGNGDPHSFGVNTFSPAVATATQNCRWDWSGSTQAAMSMISLRPVLTTGATATFWVNPTTSGGGGGGRVVEKGFVWGFDVPSDEAARFFHEQAGTTNFTRSQNNTVPFGVWTHVAMSLNKNVLSGDDRFPVYTINGAVSTTVVISTKTGDADSDTDLRMLIGNNTAYDRQFDGQIADLRLYNRILPLAEIQTIYASRGGDSIVRGLVRRYPMQSRPGLGPGASPYFASLQNTVNATTITLTVPDHDDGDTLIMVVGSGGITTTSPNITTPSGWTLVAHEDTPSAVSRPVVAVYSRTASSEPASYVVDDNVGTVSWGGVILTYRGLSTTVDTQGVSTGTTASPISPTVTPSGNAFVLRVAIMDSSAQLPGIQGDFFPTDLQYGRTAISSTGTGNGMVLGVGAELWDGTATGTRTWNAVASDEWAALTIAFLHGNGREGFPAKEVTNANVNAQVWHGVVGAEDILKGC